MKPNPCPLCGSTVSATNVGTPGHAIWNVGCNDCGLVLYGDIRKTRSNAVDTWNKLKGPKGTP